MILLSGTLVCLTRRTERSRSYINKYPQQLTLTLRPPGNKQQVKIGSKRQINKQWHRIQPSPFFNQIQSLFLRFFLMIFTLWDRRLFSTSGVKCKLTHGLCQRIYDIRPDIPKTTTTTTTTTISCRRSCETLRDVTCCLHCGWRRQQNARSSCHLNWDGHVINIYHT